MAASSSDCSMIDPVGLVARDDRPRSRAGRSGPRSWIWSRQRRSSVRDWHQSSIVPTSVTRAARLTGTRSAFALRPTRIRLCERRQLADRVGVGGDQVARLVVGPDRAAGQREGDRLAHQEVEVVAVDRDLVAFLGVARHDAQPGLVRLPRSRARRRTNAPCRRRSGCRRPAAPRRNRPLPGPRPGRARCWSGREANRPAQGRRGTTRPRPRRSGRARCPASGPRR